MPPSPRVPSLKGQILTCLAFVALAIVITISLHPDPAFSKWQVGQPLGTQVAMASGFAVLCSVGAVIALQLHRFRRLVPIPSALHNFDLSGAKPWIVALCAGVGEELLFRAALQPLVGLLLGAVIFSVAHVRTATLGSTSNAKRIAYMLNVAVAGVALGLVFEHLGLLAAVLIHATIDAVGLLVYRSLLAGGASQSAA